MKFLILSALAELGGAYARYCGRRLMRKLGGYEAAERRRVRRRAVADKRAVAVKREAAAAAGVPTLGDIHAIISEHWDVRHNALSNNLEAKPAVPGIGSSKFRQCGKNRKFHNFQMFLCV